MKKKWLENEAWLDETGNDWLAPELCRSDSSGTGNPGSIARSVSVNVKRLELTRR
jgi:hypothetical protein